ncbi:hypothetical protein D3C71_2213080 [compost metagenome]
MAQKIQLFHFIFVMRTDLLDLELFLEHVHDVVIQLRLANWIVQHLLHGRR